MHQSPLAASFLFRFCAVAALRPAISGPAWRIIFEFNDGSV
jgi:hypothetical protein